MLGLSRPEHALSLPDTQAVSGRLPAFFLFLLMATSSFVIVEPAPYDGFAVAMVLAAFGLGLRLPNRAIAPILLLFVLMVANMLSILLADPQLPGYSLPGFVRYTAITFYLILTFLLILGMVYRYQHRALAGLWGGYTVAGIIAALAGIYGYFDLGPGAESLTRNARAKGFFKDPNVLGPFLVPLLLYHFTRLLDGWRLFQVARIAIIALFLIALLLAFSRGAWANAVISFVVLVPLMFSSYRSAGQKMALIFAVLISMILLTAGLAYLSSTPALAEMVERRANLVNTYDVGEGGRFDTQKRLLPEILVAPTGYGPNQHSPGTDQAPHNVYLKVFSEYGWVGGAAWLLFCAMTVLFGARASVKRWPLQRQTIVVFACTLATTIQGLTIDTLHWRHYFVLFGILWALIILADERGTSARPVSGG